LVVEADRRCLPTEESRDAAGTLYYEIEGQSVCAGKTTASERAVKVALRAISNCSS